jgi:dihydrofolate reductase
MLNQAFNLAATADETEVFICGGGEVYREALPLVDRVYLTVVERDFLGDTNFMFHDGLGDYLPGEKMHNRSGYWRLEAQERGVGDLSHRFEIWDRVK